MIVLGISTSSRRPSAAVMRDGEIVSSFNDMSGRSHSAVLMELIEKALSEAGIEKTELEAVAVDIGPGSFTGVRIGVSCANAMAFAMGIGVIPVCSLAAMRNIGNDEGAAAVFIDCRNGNCYAAVYENGELKAGPMPAVTDEVLASLPDDARIIGDINGRNDSPSAELVLFEAARGDIEPIREAVPMYLRPSQAERMRKPD